MKMQTALLMLTATLTTVLFLSVQSKQRTKPHAPSRHFTGLGDLPGGLALSSADAVSNDGSTVIGYSHSASGIEAIRWSQKTGIIGLGFSRAVAVSADGSVIVGYHNADGQNLPVRWTAERGIEGAAARESMQDAVALDGAVVVCGIGLMQSATGRGDDAPFRRLFPHAIQLARPAIGERYVEVRASSAHGEIVVGVMRPPTGHNVAFRWASAAGPIELGALPGHSTSDANSISRDGTVVVGSSSDFTSTEAFRWTEETGLVRLSETPSIGRDSWASGVSANGTMIVGTRYTNTGPEAFVWDAEQGMRTVRQVLARDVQLQETLHGWRLHSATGVSADGRVVVGHGQNPNGDQEAWLARLTPARDDDEQVGARRSIESASTKLSSSPIQQHQR